MSYGGLCTCRGWGFRVSLKLLPPRGPPGHLTEEEASWYRHSTKLLTKMSLPLPFLPLACKAPEPRDHFSGLDLP